MSTLSNDAFVREKLHNFVAWLTSLLSKHMDNARHKEFAEKLDTLRTLDTAHWIVHVTESMCPYRANVPAYVTKMLAEHGLEPSALTPAELAKFGRYVSMWIDVVSQ